LRAWRRKAARTAPARNLAGPLHAAARTVLEQIGRGEIPATGPREFEDHCQRVLAAQIALTELAETCRHGSESSWPSPHRSRNADIWQSTYEKLAVRIADGRVDIDRPLKPLARLTARRLLLSEHRRQRRFSRLNELQLHRFNLGDGLPPEDYVERGRRREAFRLATARLVAEGRLGEVDLEILQARYVGERSSDEVAGAFGVSAENVRQICARRRALLRAELSGLDLEEAAQNRL